MIIKEHKYNLKINIITQYYLFEEESGKRFPV